MGRAERRRQERADRNRQPGVPRNPPPPPKAKQPVIIAGDGIVAASLGQQYEARPHAELPNKVPGKHRWMAMGSWVISDVDAAAAYDADSMKFLDHENLFMLSIGCWDCEQPLGPGGITADSVCPSSGD